LAAIEDALDQLLTHLLQEREKEGKRRLASGRPSALRAFSVAELVAMPIKSDEEIWRETIINNPICGALEFAIHEVGEALFQRGGTDLMRDVLERVASCHPKSYGRRVSVLDCKWDGIGNKWFY
jgi:hypothetical protein